MTNIRKIAITTAAASAIVVGSATGASAAPGDLAKIQPTSTSIEVQTPQEAAWEALVFGGLGVVYAVGTILVGH